MSDPVSLAIANAAAWLTDAGLHRRFGDLTAARSCLTRARRQRMTALRIAGCSILP